MPVATRHLHTPSTRELAHLAAQKGRLTSIRITIVDDLSPSVASIEGNLSGVSGLYRPGGSGLLEEMLRSFAGGYSKYPPVHRYIYDEFWARRELGIWPDKEPGEYKTKYPHVMRQHGNLDKAIMDLFRPEKLVRAGFFTAGATMTGSWAVSLDIGAYFNNYVKIAGPYAGAPGINYTWIHEFGMFGFPKRDFVVPALQKAAVEWELNWEVEVEAAKKILERPKEMGITPIISSTEPGRPGTISRIVHHFPERHLNWLSMLVWLLPVNRYLSILAAIKDVRGAFAGARTSMGSITQWLQSQVLGGAGMTVKSKRKSFRKKMWGG